jgi:protocatechuate 3,4-dioxygenase beta subunit
MYAPEGSLGANTEVEVTQLETRVRDLVLRRGGAIAGVVVDEDGTPVGNALLRARSRDGLPSHKVWTDAAGRFTIRGLARGRNEVVADADGFLPWSGPDVFLPSSDLLRIVLERGREVRGTVLDARGQPLAGVRVQRDPAPDYDARSAAGVATTNARGVFVMTGLPSGPIRFVVMAPDHVFGETTWNGIGPGPVLEALAPGVVSGRVLDLGGEPLENVEVVATPYEVPWRTTVEALQRRSTKTDTAGRFRFEAMIAEAFILDVVAPGRTFPRLRPMSRVAVELREVPGPGR